ncbi:9611_t:CDS:2 [Funneliformis geosporum]|nr:9611_t:CDS:2 [Funneliformis geosporum]
MKLYLADVSIGYLPVMTYKARKINRLFEYKYDPITLKKIKEQVKSKTTTSPVNEISETVAINSVHDSDDNFSITSNITDYFKEEEEGGANDSIEKSSKCLK